VSINEIYLEWMIMVVEVMVMVIITVVIKHMQKKTCEFSTRN